MASLQTSVSEFRRSHGRGIADRNGGIGPSMDFPGRCRPRVPYLGCDPAVDGTVDNSIKTSIWRAARSLPCAERCCRVSIKPRDDRSEYHQQNPIAHDLLNDHLSWHRLNDEVDRVIWHDREKCDSKTKAHALNYPRLGFDTARIDPNERAGQDQMRQYHQGKVFLLAALCPEQVTQLHVVGA